MIGAKKYFTGHLMAWHMEKNTRSMPWKGEKDPYKVWVSEIILQQTRVEQGLGYYQRFLLKYPELSRLASAPEQEVFKMWEGLGYYSRCRNLIKTAKFIAGEHKGIFPGDYETILTLPGIGPYTAAAIASFAFNLPYAVVDGNVMRVISRYFGIEQPIDAASSKKMFQEWADSLIDRERPGAYNQAIMDFGATVCKPYPDCDKCPLKKKCIAFTKDKVSELPVKIKKMIVKARWFFYFIICDSGKYYYRKRPQGDIWHNLHEFILFEGNEKTGAEQAAQKVFGKNGISIREVSASFEQKLSHQRIFGVFIHAEAPLGSRFPGYSKAKPATLAKKAFPVLINRYLEVQKLF